MAAAKRVKKRLSYMKTDDRNKLIESLKSLKRRYVTNFPGSFYDVFKDYVKHFQTRNAIFSTGVSLQPFLTLTEHLFDKISDIFVKKRKQQINLLIFSLHGTTTQNMSLTETLIQIQTRW